MAIAVVALRQTGFINRLPDLPVRGFDSERVTLSNTAVALGVPDATLSLASLAANVPLAGAVNAGRAGTQPWLPLAVTRRLPPRARYEFGACKVRKAGPLTALPRGRWLILLYSGYLFRKTRLALARLPTRGGPDAARPQG